MFVGSLFEVCLKFLFVDPLSYGTTQLLSTFGKLPLLLEYLFSHRDRASVSERSNNAFCLDRLVCLSKFLGHRAQKELLAVTRHISPLESRTASNKPP